MLFISHLDYDHVSGLKRLLTEFSVKNIILPYIEKQYRQFFLVSIIDNKDLGNLSIEDYISFIESPNTFIQNSSNETKIYFVNPDDNPETDYLGYDVDNQSEEIYPRGTQNIEIEESANGPNVQVYNNNLQFYIQRKWEFTTYAKGVSKVAINKLHDCLKKKLKKSSNKNLTFDDLKKLVTENRKDAYTCYATCIGEINSHGLVLLHGPIGFDLLFGKIYSDCELQHFYKDLVQSLFFDDYFRNKNPIMLGTLLLGDTSLNKENNPIHFPKAFINKLANVHIVQVPHHGSSKNWDLDSFENLKIGNAINRWRSIVTAVCNFGYGNKYGHPSCEVLNDLRSTIYLNTQFSRLTIKYEVIW